MAYLIWRFSKLKGKNHFCIDKLTFIRKKILKGKWRRRKEHDGSACITDSSLLVEIYPADKQCFGKAQGKIVKYF